MALSGLPICSYMLLMSNRRVVYIRGRGRLQGGLHTRQYGGGKSTVLYRGGSRS